MTNWVKKGMKMNFKMPANHNRQRGGLVEGTGKSDGGAGGQEEGRHGSRVGRRSRGSRGGDLPMHP